MSERLGPSFIPRTSGNILCTLGSLLLTDDFSLFVVGTNHFGHFYLNRLVLPMVNSNRGKIVVTASGVHDPESPGGAQGVPATLGDLSGLEKEGRSCEMIDGLPFNADKAYKDSKVRRRRFCYSSL